MMTRERERNSSELLKPNEPACAGPQSACLSFTDLSYLVRLHCAFVSRSLLSLAVLVSSDLCCPSLFVLLLEDRGPLSSQANINDSTRQLPTATERKDSPSASHLPPSGRPSHFFHPVSTQDTSLGLILQAIRLIAGGSDTLQSHILFFPTLPIPRARD